MFRLSRPLGAQSKRKRREDVKRSVWIAGLLVAFLVAPTITQQREKKAGPPDFAKEVEAATKAYGAGKYTACTHHLQRATMAVVLLRRDRVLKAFPSLGAAFTVEDDRNQEEALNNPLITYLPVNLAGVIERTYTKGEQRLQLNVTLDSPLAKTFTAMMGMFPQGDGNEMITYKQGKALLKKDGDDGYELTLVLRGVHSVVANARGFSADALLKILSQEAMDRIDKAVAD